VTCRPSAKQQLCKQAAAVAKEQFCGHVSPATTEHAILFFCNPILFAICTSIFSKLCKKTYGMACRRVLSSAPL
jgi:hypothetical protein